MKMKYTIVLSALVVSAAAELYSSKFDDMDIEAVVADNERLNAALDCLIDKGVCNEPTAEIRKDTSEAIIQKCAKCTAAQKNIAKRFLEVLKVKNPEGYQAFKQKHDPHDKYLTVFEAAVASA